MGSAEAENGDTRESVQSDIRVLEEDAGRYMGFVTSEPSGKAYVMKTTCRFVRIG